MIVVDTNIIIYLLVPGVNTKSSRILLNLDSEWIAPILWRSEFRNVIATYIRNKYFDLPQARFIMNKAEELMQGGEYQVNSMDVLELAEDSGCSAYDCEYVALARDVNVQCITSDKKLAKAFPEYVSLVNDYIRSKP